MKKLVMMLTSLLQIGSLMSRTTFVKSWKSLKMAIFDEKVSHDAHLFAPNWLTDEQDHFLWKFESWWKWRFFMKKWVMMFTSLLQIGSLMSRTTFCEKLKVTQNGDFSWKSESWCSPLCSKLAHWWAGPLFVKSWKLMKMAIFHEKVSHDVHLFAPNWLTDEQDHLLWKVESWWKWRFLMKKWVMMLISLLQIGSLMSRTTFCEKLKVDENGNFSWKSESWCSPLCSKLAHWWAGPLFVKSWKLMKMAIFHEKVSHDAHLFAPNWLTDEQDHFLWKVESWWKWRFFMKKWVMMLTSLLQIGSLMSRTTFVKSWKLMKMAIFHEKVSHDAHLFAPNWLTDEQDHFLWKVESWWKWRFFMKKWVMMFTSLLQIGSLMSRTTFCEKLKVDENGDFSWKSESWSSPLCSKLAHWWAGPLFVKSWKLMKMAIFHEKVSHDAHLFAPNWLTDEQDHFCEKLKVTENGDFWWKSESWCSPLCSKLAHWWAGPLFVKSWKLMKMAIFHEKVSHDVHLFAPNWLTDEQDHFLWKVESHSKWRFFMKKWVMMLTSLLQISSLMSRTTFCEKLKVDENGDFSWKSESWCSPLCSKLAHWWAGPPFVKSWKLMKMAIFHEKVSHDAHLFAPNWLTDEQDHFLWKVESWWKWRFFMKKWVMMLTSLLQIGSLMSRTTFCEKLKVDENGDFSWKSESWCSPLAPNWLTDEKDHFLWKVESWWKWRFFMKKWVMMLTSLLQIGSLMSRTTFCEKLKVDENGDFSWKSESWCSPLCSKLAHWWAGPPFVKSWKLMKMVIFHEKVSHDAHLFAPNWLTDEQDHFLWKVESWWKWRFFMKKWVMMLTSLLQIGSLMSRTTFCE